MELGVNTAVDISNAHTATAVVAEFFWLNLFDPAGPIVVSRDISTATLIPKNINQYNLSESLEGLANQAATSAKPRRIRLLERLKTRLRPKPRHVCANCGYPFFSNEVLLDGKRMAFCLRCHTINIVGSDNPPA